MQRPGIRPSHVDNLVFGNVIHTEPADAYMARAVGMKAGVPKEVRRYTVNHLWHRRPSNRVRRAAIQTGEAGVALAGGAESMSRELHVLPQVWGARSGDMRLIDSVVATSTRCIGATWNSTW